MATSRKNKIQSPAIPTLSRVILRELEVKRGELSAPKLTAEYTHNISLVLIKPVEGKTQVRINGEISLEGKWLKEGETKPAISFLGVYEARFIFSTKIPYELVSHWMKDAFYRDSAIAQAMPVINLHMYSQLEMMGLNPHKKKIGYESKSEWQESEQLPVATAVRRARKTTAVVK